MKTLLTRLNITNFDAETYIQNYQDNASALPNIGIAVSGGGWRTLLNGAGAIEAFDSRTPQATKSGHLGGLLQSSTYLAGLSGGSWLVGSIFMNNFSTITALRDTNSGSLWEFGNSVLEGPDEGGLQIFNTADYYKNLVEDVTGKEDAGFDITITDIWGRSLSYQLINATDGGPKYTWSSIAQSQGFMNGDTPLPVVISDEKFPNEVLIAQNTTIYEFNPFEMGTWDAVTYGFVPTKYLGSNFSAGVLPPGDQCVIGFDNGGFVMGTSSSLFNQILLGVNATSLPSIVKNVLNTVLGKLGANNEDIADYSPNPFYSWNNDTNPSANSSTLTLVDGGEDNENLPLHPLLQPVRHVDVIFALDNSADTSLNWPNGSSLVQTYERSLSFIANGTAFPSIPDPNTFINLGLNKRPTFFGCNSTNISSEHQVPLIVYIPNAPYTYYSNVSTYDLAYNDTERDAIILNGYNVATIGNGTSNSSWPMCVGCAILSRSFERTSHAVPEACQTCFSEFCWDGRLNATQPASYEPTTSLTKAASAQSAAHSVRKRAGGLSAVLAAVATSLALA